MSFLSKLFGDKEPANPDRADSVIAALDKVLVDKIATASTEPAHTLASKMDKPRYIRPEIPDAFHSEQELEASCFTMIVSGVADKDIPGILTDDMLVDLLAEHYQLDEDRAKLIISMFKSSRG